MSAEQEAVVSAMGHREFYPHETTIDIEVIQTHSAYVFLTGPYAYKVKKAVDLGFLDFSTLSKRQHFCEEEVRLNRHFGSTLYRGVRSVVREGEIVRLGDSGKDAIEYAVEMEQFDQAEVLLARLQRGALTDDHVREVATSMAAMHRKANLIADNSQGPDTVRHAIEENFDGVRPYIGETENADRFETARRYELDCVERLETLIRWRAGEGRVRECHGDLHLNNMCLHRGRIEFFDCIDFNEDFRNIDVMYELAFALMDLEYHGAPELANVMMNAYLEESGDYAGAALLPLYKHMRAYVRGKVASILTDETEVAEPQRASAAESAAKHFEYAHRIALGARPRLIVMCGLSGSGKSTVARAIAGKFEAIHIRSDAVRKHLCGVALGDHGADIYTDDITQRTYARMGEIALTLLGSGLPVILDATYSVRQLRTDAILIADGLSVPVNIIHCVAPPQERASRLSQREGDVSDATPGLIVQQDASFEGLDESERRIAVEVDTNGRWNVYGVLAEMNAQD